MQKCDEDMKEWGFQKTQERLYDSTKKTGPPPFRALLFLLLAHKTRRVDVNKRTITAQSYSLI